MSLDIPNIDIASTAFIPCSLDKITSFTKFKYLYLLVFLIRSNLLFNNSSVKSFLYISIKLFKNTKLFPFALLHTAEGITL